MSRTKHVVHWMAALAALPLALTACGGGGAQEEAGGADAATVEPISGSELRRVTLSEDAVGRIGLQVEAVAADGAGPGTRIPYSAVLYDPQGRTWAFVGQDQRSFVREPLVISRIDGQVAFLTTGPAVGAKVVTAGSTELYGAEVGVGDE